MDNKAIETLSINAVRDSIVVSDYLDQFIADNDKEPSWDGFVYIYNDKSKKKCTLTGRVPVQVKGKQCDDHSNDEISYQVSITDLNNYLSNGGIVFFVVYIDQTGTKKQIYYVALTPIKIRMILTGATGQQSASVKLKKFPDDPNMKTLIFCNCFEDCRKQASFSKSKLLSLPELEKAGVLEGLSISVTTVAGIDPKTAIHASEAYLYANIKGGAIPQPIEAVLVGLVEQEEKDAVISVGDRVFYTKVNLFKTVNTVTTLIGESFTIVANLKEHSIRFTYRSTDKLRALVVDLDFLLSFIENKSFKYDDIEFPLDESSANFNQFDPSAQRERLVFLKKVVQALDSLGCKKDIHIKELTERDWRDAEYLVKAFVDKEPVSGLKPDLPPVMSLNIGDLCFVVALAHVKNEPGTYVIHDYFATEYLLIYDGKNGEKLPLSQFALLRADGLLKAANIRYDVLLPSFQKIVRHSELMFRSTLFMLELIEAYDEDNSKVELLTTASAFADWIMEATEEEMPYDARLLNKLQIEKRKGDLTKSQLRKLYELVVTPDKCEEVLVGAYLLLGQQEAAEMHFERMDPQVQEEFKKYPIYHFWKDDGGHKKE